MGVAISIRHLCKSYRKVNAVQDLSFDVNEGDIYGFLGPNGAGKTTTMRILATLLRPRGDGDQLVDAALFRISPRNVSAIPGPNLGAE